MRENIGRFPTSCDAKRARAEGEGVQRGCPENCIKIQYFLDSLNRFGLMAARDQCCSID